MGRGKKIGITTAAIIGFFMIITILSFNTSDGEQSIKNNTGSFAPEFGSQKIVDASFQIERGGFVVFPIDPPGGVSDVRLKGTFSSDGGVKVGVMDAQTFEKWKAGQRIFYYGEILYSSGDEPVKSGVVDTALPSQELYLNIHNRDDLDNPRQVTAQFEITYTRFVNTAE
jgi:hypothetical protein